MALTQEQIAEIRSKYGIKPTPNAQQNPNSVNVGELQKAWGVTPPAKPAPALNFVKNTAQDLYARGKNLSDTISSAGQDIANYQNPNVPQGVQATPEELKAGSVANTLATLGKTALKTVGEIGAGVGDIFLNAFGAVKENISDETKNKIKQSKPYQDITKTFNTENLKPEVKNFLSSLGEKANQNPEIASALTDALNSTGLIIPAAEKAIVPEIKSSLSGVADITREKVIPAVERGFTVATQPIKGAAERMALRAEEKVGDKVWDIIQPKLSKGEEILARKEGLVTESRFGTTKLVPDSTYDQELIDAAKVVLNPKGTVNENMNLLSTRVTELNQANKSFLRQNDGIFNSGELRNALEATKKSDAARRAVVFGGDAQLEKAYDSMVDGFMETVKKYPNKYSSVLDARQEFDRIANSVIPKAFDTEARDTVKKIALRDIRNGANDFITSRVSGGGAIADSLRNQTLLLETLENIAEKAPRVGTSAWKRWEKDNKTIAPLVKTILLYGGLAAGGGLITGAIIK